MRGTTFLALLPIRQVAVVVLGHIEHRAATHRCGGGRLTELRHDAALCDKHTGAAWTAEELMSGEEDRVLVRQR